MLKRKTLIAVFWATAVSLILAACTPQTEAVPVEVTRVVTETVTVEAVLNEVEVQEGDRVVDVAGEVVELAVGDVVQTSNGEEGCFCISPQKGLIQI